jgi:hypothetical protein
LKSHQTVSCEACRYAGGCRWLGAAPSCWQPGTVFSNKFGQYADPCPVACSEDSEHWACYVGHHLCGTQSNAGWSNWNLQQLLLGSGRRFLRQSCSKIWHIYLCRLPQVGGFPLLEMTAPAFGPKLITASVSRARRRLLLLEVASLQTVSFQAGVLLRYFLSARTHMIGVATPTPTQPGMVSNCNEFYLVKKVVKMGDSCRKIASDLGITLDQFTTWNSQAGKDCSALWGQVYACVGNCWR